MGGGGAQSLYSFSLHTGAVMRVEWSPQVGGLCIPSSTPGHCWLLLLWRALRRLVRLEYTYLMGSAPAVPHSPGTAACYICGRTGAVR